MSEAAGAYVISGPTAVGKGTVVAALKKRHPRVFVSVSVTTRPPRPGEINGVHYLFVDDAVFDDLVADDGLLEWARVHGVHRYGTPRKAVADRLAEGVPTILEIDLQGARQINAYYAQLGEGLLESVGPLVETLPQEKPLSIALREVQAGQLQYTQIDPEAEAAARAEALNDPDFSLSDPFGDIDPA